MTNGLLDNSDHHGELTKHSEAAPLSLSSSGECVLSGELLLLVALFLRSKFFLLAGLALGLACGFAATFYSPPQNSKFSVPLRLSNQAIEGEEQLASRFNKILANPAISSAIYEKISARIPKIGDQAISTRFSKEKFVELQKGGKGVGLTPIVFIGIDKDNTFGIEFQLPIKPSVETAENLVWAVRSGIFEHPDLEIISTGKVEKKSSDSATRNSKLLEEKLNSLSAVKIQKYELQYALLSRIPDSQRSMLKILDIDSQQQDIAVFKLLGVLSAIGKITDEETNKILLRNTELNSRENSESIQYGRLLKELTELSTKQTPKITDRDYYEFDPASSFGLTTIDVTPLNTSSKKFFYLMIGAILGLIMGFLFALVRACLPQIRAFFRQVGEINSQSNMNKT